MAHSLCFRAGGNQSDSSHRSHRRRRHRTRGHLGRPRRDCCRRCRHLDGPNMNWAVTASCATARCSMTRPSKSCAPTTPSCSAPSARPTCRRVSSSAPAAEGSLRAGSVCEPAARSPCPTVHSFTVIRENTEGTYAGEGGFMRKGTPHEIATQGSVNTRMGAERAIRYGFELAPRRRAAPSPDAGPQDQCADVLGRPVGADLQRGSRRVPPMSRLRTATSTRRAFISSPIRTATR